MSVTTQITSVLNGTIQAVKSIIPLNLEMNKPLLVTEPFLQQGICVIIGMTGDVRGRLIIEGNSDAISLIGERMFGMTLEGEMLESFAAEFGNMIAGNLSTQLTVDNIIMDISPPTVLVGETKMYGIEKAIHLPITIEADRSIHILLMIES
ncbi:chemotaxis protein CheX [Peribacillus huizhouensis]|uniref:Chemotaxis protein CheX n=1 Tax=Peribacillus huizhouensis TaxID=1501239 RepID=A0ABR6CS19_9BACI|nr:chemotaxis protein CheX [Peribacillus huizhouensis]MBA9027755.1 chemotaxis protein CheX [Peribacillus huizhouensis]